MREIVAALLGRRRRLPPVHVRIYGRPGCHLCDEAERWLRAEGSHVVLEVVDVSADPELESRHGRSVPVVEIEGRVRLKARFNRAELASEVRRAARAAGSKGGPGGLRRDAC